MAASHIKPPSLERVIAVLGTLEDLRTMSPVSESAHWHVAIDEARQVISELSESVKHLRLQDSAMTEELVDEGELFELPGRLRGSLGVRYHSEASPRMPGDVVRVYRRRAKAVTTR